MQRLTNPFPAFHDTRGALLDAGKIYIGEAGQDPEAFPITVYWDEAGTQAAAQPLRTLGGYIVNGSSPAQVYIEEESYSIRIRDADDVQIFFASDTSDIIEPGAVYQPLDSDLTAIAALSTTVFGRALLTLADAAALRAYAGVSSGLPTTGGTVSGNIMRAGAGPHLYFSDTYITPVSGRVIVTPNGAADPTVAVGEIWLELEP